MNCVVIGYGSIGSRHAHILREMGHGVLVVSRRDIHEFACRKTVRDALEAAPPDYVVISNETCRHYESFNELETLGYSGKILIEKPVFSELHAVSEETRSKVFVAYNLRFHPVIQKIRSLIQRNRVYSIQVYAGQYLPDWRPGVDYTKGYSASREMGGGVLRDLSHELDYVNWLAGGWKRVAAIGGKFSDLRINSDDTYAILLEMKNCPVASVQVNYLDRVARREIVVNLEGGTIQADLVSNTLETNGTVERFEVERNLTYRLQHEAIMNDQNDTACTLDQGIDVVRLIHAAEAAADKQVWVSRLHVEGTL